MSTDSFFELTPERVLDAVEAAGFRCTGRCIPLNSYENRVYELELEAESEDEPLSRNAYELRRVVKFYRPGRWTREQILEEHRFLSDLTTDEVPVVATLPDEKGETLHRTSEGDLWYAIFPKVGGRIPDELSEEQLLRLGRLLARIHNVGASRSAPDRLRLTTKTYGLEPLDFLVKGSWLPPELSARYEEAVREILTLSERPLSEIPVLRIHGDCHPGNLLWGREGPFFLDFDDMLNGPPVQDVWLLVPGRDAEAKSRLGRLLDGYDEIRPFDRTTLSLIEVLRSLRFVHYSAWLARRWKDPAFPIAFPQFNTFQYWEEKVGDMEEQLRFVRQSLSG